MQSYLDLVRRVFSEGTRKPSRTGVDTISLFSAHYQVDLAAGFPLLTTKKMNWPAVLRELPDTRRRRVAFAVGLVVAMGTSAWSTLSRAPWSQTTSLVFASLAVLTAFKVATRAPETDGRWGRDAVVLGATAALAYVARPTGAVLVLGLGC